MSDKLKELVEILEIAEELTQEQRDETSELAEKLCASGEISDEVYTLIRIILRIASKGGCI